MSAGISDKAAILAKLPVRPDEDPFAVTIGGFYRRWFNLIDDLQLLIDTVATLKGTEDEDWVPAWSAVAARYEKEAEAAAHDAATAPPRATPSSRRSRSTASRAFPRRTTPARRSARPT